MIIAITVITRTDAVAGNGHGVLIDLLEKAVRVIRYLMPGAPRALKLR